MTDDWPQIKARLEELVRLMPGETSTQTGNDIRAALQRVEELELEKERITSDWAKWEVECGNRLRAAEAKLARVMEAGDQIVARNCGDAEVALWTAAKVEK